VDDHALVRLGLAQVLGAQPDLEVVAQAEGMTDTLRQLKAARPDLITIDISLRDGSGLELVKHIRAIDDSIKILVLSMHDEVIFAKRALKAQASGYINKDEAPQTTIGAIRTVLAGGIYLSPRMTKRILEDAAGRKPEGSGTPVEDLSDRELEVFELIGRGRTTRQIAEALHVTIKTVETHRERIKDKLALKNGAELIQSAMRWTFEQGSMDTPAPE
jgi:DNA-binding NarL/FixJ family response regulator